MIKRSASLIPNEIKDRETDAITALTKRVANGCLTDGCAGCLTAAVIAITFLLGPLAAVAAMR